MATVPAHAAPDGDVPTKPVTAKSGIRRERPAHYTRDDGGQIALAVAGASFALALTSWQMSAEGLDRLDERLARVDAAGRIVGTSPARADHDLRWVNTQRALAVAGTLVGTAALITGTVLLLAEDDDLPPSFLPLLMPDGGGAVWVSRW